MEKGFWEIDQRLEKKYNFSVATYCYWNEQAFPIDYLIIWTRDDGPVFWNKIINLLAERYNDCIMKLSQLWWADNLHGIAKYNKDLIACFDLNYTWKYTKKKKDWIFSLILSDNREIFFSNNTAFIKEKNANKDTW